MKKIICTCFVVVVLVSFGLIYGVCAENQEIITPKNFGHGVYFFSVMGERAKEVIDPEIFGRSLAVFKARHPNFKVTSIARRLRA